MKKRSEIEGIAGQLLVDPVLVEMVTRVNGRKRHEERVSRVHTAAIERAQEIGAEVHQKGRTLPLAWLLLEAERLEWSIPYACSQRLPFLAHLGKGRREATDGKVWSLAIEQAQNKIQQSMNGGLEAAIAAAPILYGYGRSREARGARLWLTRALADAVECDLTVLQNHEQSERIAQALLSCAQDAEIAFRESHLVSVIVCLRAKVPAPRGQQLSADKWLEYHVFKADEFLPLSEFKRQIVSTAEEDQARALQALCEYKHGEIIDDRTALQMGAGYLFDAIRGEGGYEALERIWYERQGPLRLTPEELKKLPNVCWTVDEIRSIWPEGKRALTLEELYELPVDAATRRDIASKIHARYLNALGRSVEREWLEKILYGAKEKND